jgi:hypothetical protein
MAELTPEAKNAISHRSRAVMSIRPVLEAWLSRRSPVKDPLEPQAAEGDPR